MQRRLSCLCFFGFSRLINYITLFVLSPMQKEGKHGVMSVKGYDKINT